MGTIMFILPLSVCKDYLSFVPDKKLKISEICFINFKRMQS